MRVVFFILAVLSLFPAAAGWLDMSTLSPLRAKMVEEADAANAKLKAFKFDDKGNVPPEKRAAFERDMSELEMRTSGLRGLNESLGHAELYAYGGTGGFAVFLVLGLVMGRKKVQPGQPQQGYPQQGYPQQGYPQQGAPQAAGMEDNVAGALCYVLGVLTGVLFLFLEPYNKNREIKFHAFQAIFFWAGAVVATIATSIIGTLVAFLPYIGWIISLLLWTLIPLGVFGIWALLIYKAYNKEHWLLPILGPLAEKQAYTS